MIAIRGGSGLGDSLYVQAIARHIIAGGRGPVEVCSDWPDVFRPLGDRVKVSPFRRQRIDRLAHYASRRGIAGTTQFEDCCLSAGLLDAVELRLDWRIVDHDLAAKMRDGARPVVAVMLPRAPMGRKDGFGAELLPDCRVLQRAIDRVGKAADIVQIGAGSPLFHFSGIDLDLANRTSVSQLLDVAASIDGFVGYPSFVIPLAESFGKPALIVWSHNGLNSAHLVIRQMTPQKLLHGSKGRAVVDNQSAFIFDRAFDAFCDEIRAPALV